MNTKHDCFNRLSPLEINPRMWNGNCKINQSIFEFLHQFSSRLIGGAIFRCLVKSQYRFWQFLLSCLSNLVQWICFSMHFKKGSSSPSDIFDEFHVWNETLFICPNRLSWIIEDWLVIQQNYTTLLLILILCIRTM